MGLGAFDLEFVKDLIKRLSKDHAVLSELGQENDEALEAAEHISKALKYLYQIEKEA